MRVVVVMDLNHLILIKLKYKPTQKYIDSPEYFDEGFMNWNTADVLLASIDPRTPKSKDLIISIKKRYPGVKFIRPENFKKIMTTEHLLRLMYKLRDERDTKELMKEPLHKYEENINILNEL